MPATASPLKTEFEWYLAHQPELVKQYDGQVVAIKDHAVLGAYVDLNTALGETSKRETLGTFLLQKVTPGTEAYTQRFHSRVSFENA